MLEQKSTIHWSLSSLRLVQDSIKPSSSPVKAVGCFAKGKGVPCDLALSDTTSSTAGLAKAEKEIRCNLLSKWCFCPGKYIDRLPFCNVQTIQSGSHTNSYFYCFFYFYNFTVIRKKR